MGWKLPNYSSEGEGCSHANILVLDELTDRDGKLHYKGMPIGTEITSIEASKVLESIDRQFVTVSQKAQIDSNATELASHSSRLYALENREIPDLEDQYVKMNESDSAGFLGEKIDNTTIKSISNKLTATSLSGLVSTIHELNQLTGITGNVQSQINSLTSVGNFTGSVPTFADVEESFPDPQAGDMVIVITDETEHGESTIYVHNGNEWIYSGKFSASIRDFTTNPLDLEGETTNTLPKDKYEKQNALETPITDAAGNFVADNVEDALAELFIFASSFKQSVVTAIGSPLLINDTRDEVLEKITRIKNALAIAITDKGVPTYPYNTMQEMTEKIARIPNVELKGQLKRTAKINVTAPYEYEIALSAPLSLEQISATVLSYIEDKDSIVHYEAEYNNAEKNNFDYEESEVVFDGLMRLNDEWRFELNEMEEGEYYVSDEIDFSLYSDVRSIVADTNERKIYLKGLKERGQVIKASGDILLLGVERVDSISVISNVEGNGIAKMAMSFDGGVSWKSYQNGKWISVNIADGDDFRSNGMNSTQLNSITNQILNDGREGSHFIRFAYYLEQPNFQSVANNDRLEIRVSMQGRNEIANTNKYSYDYDPVTRLLKFKFVEDGTYSVTYMDAQV